MNQVLDCYAEAMHMHMHMHMLSPPAESSNPSEWAKKKLCMDSAMSMELDFLNPLTAMLIDAGEQKSRAKEGHQDQKFVDGVKAQSDAPPFGALNG